MLNLVKLVVLSLVVIFISSLLGHMVLGESGRLGGILIGILGCVLIYNSAEKTLFNIFKPKPTDITSFPVLYQVTSEVASKIGIAMPNLYVLNEHQPNLFSIGVYNSTASIIVTSGLLRTLDRRELIAVIAHECVHILHQDILCTTIVAQIASFLTGCADYVKSPTPSSNDEASSKKSRYSNVHYILGLFLSLVAAICVQTLISRSDDLEADAIAANAVKDPEALSRALQKIQKSVEQTPIAIAEKYPATLAMFIVSPIVAKDFIHELFITQAKTSERTKRLEQAAEL
jgi:heat shock protein HtpX